MPRATTGKNRFAEAGKELTKAPVTAPATSSDDEEPKEAKQKKKDKVISAKVYPETWTAFTEINQAQGMTNNSVINMLISKYIREQKEILSK